MDYALEELKRQRMALAALLMGGAEPEQRKDRRETTRGLPAEELADSALDFWNAAAAWEDTQRRSAEDAGRRAADYGRDGVVWRTAPFAGEEEASGAWSGLLEAESTAGRRDVGTGIPLAGGGVPEPMNRADLTAEAAVPARMAAGERTSITEPGRTAGAESAAAQEKRQDSETVRAEAQGRSTAWELPGASADRWLSYAAGTAASQEGEVRTASGFARQAEAAEARALSLAFQRDARRYNGGFAIY